MKLAKQIKVDLSKAYQCAMEISILNMKAPLRYINQYIAEDVNGYGTAADEKVRSRADFRKMVMDARRQAKGTVFKAKIITPYQPKFINETTVQFRDEMVVQIGAKKSNHSLHLWFSTLFRYQHEKWQMVFFHGSVPDAGSSSDDTFHLGEAEKKVKELEQVVALRTLDLQKKNKELEIESALEKVRAVAMGMHKPDDMLGVCKILYHELKSLGFDDLRNAMIHSFPEDNVFFINYDYSLKTGGQVAQIPVKGNTSIEKFVKAIRKSANAFHHLVVKGKELKDWITFRKANKEPNDPRLNKIESLHYYNYSVGNSGIGISTYSPITKEKQQLLQRFRNVFQLAYQRYADIMLAEAQVREAQIEASLERVRSRSLSMHNTSELQDVIHTVHKELLNLNIAINGGSFIAINSDIETTLRCWGSGGTANTTEEVHIPLYKKPFCTNLINRIKKGPGFFTEAFTQKEKKDFFTFLFKHEPWSKLKAKEKKETLSSPGGYTRSCFVSNHTSIFIINHLGEIFSTADNEILQRFGKVFEQSYTRFLDLQKAEVSAREAQIEAALEKVRSTSLAMHKSDELKDVILEVLKKLQDLGIAMENRATAIFTYEKESKDYYQWVASPEYKTIISFLTPYIDHPVQNDIWNARQNGTDFYAKSYTVQEKNTLFKYFFELPALKNMPQKEKKKALGFKYYDVAIAFEKNSAIILVSHSGIPLTEGENAILKRFAKVFEQSYTRFLDLQKAEAQAREAEIELALERVRARTMAMQHSEELLEVATVLFQQVKGLGVPQWNCGFNIWEPGDKAFTYYPGSPDGVISPSPCKIPLNDHPVFRRFDESRKKGIELLVYEKEGEEQKDHYQYMLSLPGVGDLLQSMLDAGFELPTFQIDHLANFAYGNLIFITYEQFPEMHQVFKRFAKVFEQTYTRFLDLQKAESQAREATIEAALEKVRSRSLAMHSSEELGEVVSIVLEKLQELGFVMDDGSAAHINIYPEGSKDAVQWSAAPFQSAPIRSKVPYTDNILLTDFFEAKEKGLDFFSKKYSFEEKNSWFHYAFEHSDFKYLPDTLKQALLSSESYEHWIAIGKNSTIIVNSISGKVLSEEEIEILKRFARVFEQSYVRFLDLEKAEAQTREAQINLAVERVRARALAMFKSDEIMEVVAKLKDEVMGLDIPDVVAATIFLSEGKNHIRMWDLSSLEKIDGAYQQHLDVTFKLKSNDPHLYVKRVWENPADYFVEIQDGKGLKRIVSWLRENNKSGMAQDVETFIESTQLKQLYHAAKKLNNGKLCIDLLNAPPKEMESILTKMGAAFDLAYKRFEDLQNAEASAREAQIEASLERVRSRSMAMHKSDELKEAGELLWNELTKLGIQSLSSGYVLMDREEKIGWIYAPNPATGKIAEPIGVVHTETKEMLAVLAGWRKQAPLIINEMNEGETITHQTFIAERSLHQDGTILRWITAEQLIALSPKKLFLHNFNFKEGYLLIVGGERLTEEQIELMLRFTKVFQQTYTRFLDLQKAEAQARESQIELALERVRSQAMAMQKSSDLLDIVVTMRTEFSRLGHEAHYFWHMMWLPEKYEKAMTSGDGTKIGFVMELPRHMHGDIPLLAKWEKSKKPTAVYAMNAEEAIDYVDKMVSLGDFKNIDPQAPSHDDIRHIGGLTFIMARTTHGEIGFSLPGVVEHPPKEDVDILIRFAGAFDIAHRRFLDLQKSEAQSREMEIELALEKVRSRSMGMQKSEELTEAIKIVYQQLNHLKIKLDHAGFVVDYSPKGDWHFWIADEQDIPSKITHPYFESVWATQFNKAKENGVDFFATHLNFEEKNKFYRELLSHVPGIPEASKDFYLSCPALAASTVLFNHVSLYMENFAGIPYTDDENKILLRFGKVFQQTYTRFLDLQNAEASTREAKIEAALEKVRSRSLAMHNANELGEVITVVFEKLNELDFTVKDGVALITFTEGSKDLIEWMTNPGFDAAMNIHLPYFDHPILSNLWKAKDEGKEFFVKRYDADENKSFLNHIFEYTEFKHTPQDIKDFCLAADSYATSIAFQKNTAIFINDYSGLSLSENEITIFNRFAKVFEQAYIRFLDLQKAEAQAKEAHIEAALERVRSQSMGMQTSKDFSNVTTAMFEQLRMLGGELFATGIVFCDKHEGHVEQWHSLPDAGMLSPFIVPVNLDYIHQYRYDQWKKGTELFSIEIPGDFIVQHFNDIFNLPSAQVVIKEFEANNTPMPATPPWEIDYGASFKHGYILASALQPFAEADILPRFAKVFEQTYIRFLDLQKAEAQAREAKIEMALEKVRASAMAMHHSHELDELLTVLFDQFDVLGIQPITTHMTLIDMENNTFTFRETGKGGRRSFGEQRVAIDSMDIWTDAANKWRNSEPLAINSLHFPPESLPMLWQIFHESFAAMPEDAKITPEDYPNGIYHTAGKLPFGYIGMNQVRKPTQEEEQIVVRFASEFGRAYTRFLDLQKAEAQAREAQIETALEKVRSRTMAMQSSNELQETAAVLFQEFKKLGAENIYQVTIGIYNEIDHTIDFRVTSWADSGEQENRSFSLDMNEPYLIQPAISAWKSGKKSAVFDLTGEALQGWLNYRNKMSGITVKSSDTDGRRVITAAYFSKGHLTISTPIPPPQETIKTLERFTTVFDGTYTRFLDLEKAEAQAREAKIEAALERVRSRTLAMQKSDELADTSIVIFEQLINLGIEPNRLFIGIINDKTQNIEAWATNEDGTRIGNHFTLNTDRNESVKKMYEGWKHKKTSITIDMQGTELQNYFHYLADEMKIPFKGGLSQKRRVQTIAYFGQGLIGMASPDEQPEETTRLLERFAAVFNLTYTRFNDLKIAEAHAIQAEEDLIKLQTEKSRAEDALTNLQATQKQLVQSEKMASLGELTAGIAHEIQNPLNFVNNFSEVSKELLDEMKEAIEKGDTEDAKEIMNDVIQNLEKINHHGKRADGIVKGMLQHSRSSSGQKELTDINALCDEYLRLSYHGLRAKDKSFNATMKTDFDTSIGNINVLSQDLGRVILNLLTNAFYVVNEKKQQGAEKYEPTVSISTKKVNDKVEIKVTDNGNGIPQKVVEKIFQPFFPTKPTGKGTGLGLSLSYDIITKGHSGELSVETVEKEGSTFTISLPI